MGYDEPEILPYPSSPNVSLVLNRDTSPHARLSVAAYMGMCRARSDARLPLATKARILSGKMEPTGRIFRWGIQKSLQVNYPR